MNKVIYPSGIMCGSYPAVPGGTVKNLFRAVVQLITLLLTLTTLPACARQTPPNVSDLVKSTVDAVVLIVITDETGKPIAEGSGFIISGDGKIVTNHHVMQGAHSATVKLNNGAFFQVEGIVADDPEHDLAIIKVPGKNLPTLTLADSDRISVGDRVLAIGSPLGLENSVTDGIVSALRDDSKGRSWIQTTAPASHGNSGGPLLLMDGKVIGVLTWKASEGENLNFAVPSKSIPPLLSESNVRPLGSAAKHDLSPSPTQVGERVWTSMTTGKDYKIRVDGDYIYAEWILPPALQSTTAFMRAELKKVGDKWIGKGRSFLPYEYKSTYGDYWKTGQRVGTPNVNWCRLEVDMEIDKFQESRIEGQAQNFTTFDAKKCQPGKLELKSFTWILK
jgi:hypothetical protein